VIHSLDHSLLAAVTPPPAGAAAALPHAASHAATAAGHAAPAAGALPATSATLSPQVLQQLGLNFGHKTALAQHAPWLTHTFAALFMICAVSLIILLACQTTKQEGLSGTIGGKVESAYRPRLGFDQQLQRLTSYVAIGFVFFAVVLSIAGI
jgi:protein translocase SecG subunit